MYNVSPCWVISYQRQITVYGFKLYTAKKCIMSALVGLFHAKDRLPITVSNYILQKNV